MYVKLTKIYELNLKKSSKIEQRTKHKVENNSTTTTLSLS